MHNNNNGYPSSARAWATVAILMVAYVLSFVDRQILNLLVEPIRRDLAINDTQMSLLMGLSFALFYTVCGIPLGRVADTRSRRGLIAVGILFWSAATAACGMAKMYWQFLLCRIGVGVGEAALSPAAYSLIADSFPAERRATAISVYSMGVYLGSGLAFLVGGLVIQFASAQGDVTLPVLGEVRPWQLIFLILGVAGVFFTLLMTAMLFALAGLINAVFAKSFDDISIIPTFVLTPLTYLGGVFYSIELLPGFWQTVSHGNPVLYMVNAFRYGFLGISDVNLWVAYGLISVFIVALYLLVWQLLRRGTGIRH